jgi:heme A synthase
MPPNKKERASFKYLNEAIRSITTPLGFFVLALLIIEGTLGVVLTWSKLSENHVWNGFICMIIIFACVILIVSLFAWRNPRHLLYGKEEHLQPQLEASALRDQIEDLIYKNVRREALITNIKDPLCGNKS